jgi:hypothetical protein
MQEDYYEVEDDLGHTLATKMSLKNALIFVGGLFDEYYADDHAKYTIKRCPKPEFSVIAEEM